MLARVASALLALMIASSVASAATQSVADLKDHPQKMSAYMPASPDARITPEAEQNALAGEFLRRHFAPWTNEDLSYLDLTLEQVISYGASLTSRKLFVDGGKRFPDAAMEKLRRIASGVTADARPRPGITLAQCDLRVLPTNERLYTNAASAKGANGLLKLDALQSSSIKAGEPIAIYGASADSNWVYVSTESVVGWIPAKCAAPISAETRARIMNSPHRVAVRDDIAVKGEGGRTLAVLKLGALLPSDGAALLFPVRGDDGSAVLAHWTPPAGSFDDFPAPFTARRAVAVCDELIGEPYGWGGLDGRRDCSAMTRDYFAVFGVWLPRNSGDQEGTGDSITLKNVAVAQRERVVAQRAVPFASIIHMPGHIMLYIGDKGGVPLVLHNMWGIRTNAAGGKTGRHVVGRCVVTTLRPGRELKNRAKRSLLVDNIDSITYPLTQSITQ